MRFRFRSLIILVVAALAVVYFITDRKTSSASEYFDSLPLALIDSGDDDPFEVHGVQGAFVMLDTATGRLQTSNRDLATTGFRPQSMFKIIHALFGLRTGAIIGDGRIEWKPTVMNPDKPLDSYFVKQWGESLTFAQTMQYSCLPFFQHVVAPQIGTERMTELLAEFDYGNNDISAGIDQFWIEGPFRITPLEQVRFMFRLLADDFNVTQVHKKKLWDPLKVQERDLLSDKPDPVYQRDVPVFAKTGSGYQDGHVIGWHAGFAAPNGDYLNPVAPRYIFTTLVRSKERFPDKPTGNDLLKWRAEFSRIIPLRPRITRDFLSRLGALR